jgi:hypothetical protein
MASNEVRFQVLMATGMKGCLLGCRTMQSVRYLPTFQRCFLSPPSERRPDDRGNKQL